MQGRRSLWLAFELEFIGCKVRLFWNRYSGKRVSKGRSGRSGLFVFPHRVIEARKPHVLSALFPEPLSPNSERRSLVRRRDIPCCTCNLPPILVSNFTSGNLFSRMQLKRLDSWGLHKGISPLEVADATCQSLWIFSPARGRGCERTVHSFTRSVQRNRLLVQSVRLRGVCRPRFTQRPGSGSLCFGLRRVRRRPVW